MKVELAGPIWGRRDQNPPGANTGWTDTGWSEMPSPWVRPLQIRHYSSRPQNFVKGASESDLQDFDLGFRITGVCTPNLRLQTSPQIKGTAHGPL